LPLTAVVMAIKQYHAARIYSGEKRFEFRRLRPRFDLPAKIYIYEPTPVRMVSGFFYASAMFDVDGDIATYESDVSESSTVAEYLAGGRRPTAIRVDDPCRLSRPVPLGSFGVTAAPQSYVYVDAE